MHHVLWETTCQSPIIDSMEYYEVHRIKYKWITC